jgi:gamma-glutamylcyclotransferase (GGCT)/AIG2-like uncharacterized protein YtfP
MVTPPDYVFCYGTLMNDEVWEGVTNSPAESICDSGVLRGWCKRIGPWGFLEASPSTAEGAELTGVVRPVRSLRTWMYLDYFEGTGIPGARYTREVVSVVCEDGSVVTAGVYASTGGDEE